ncbi:Putative Mitochondrion organization and biogenesis protein [Aspergillus calidoustus]|uniref:Required for respiratory growth protein 9, mitochondrial n=1 Tax=Aspergillus calidoustus TaxID=454130 RepID=A0A0U5FRX1_ASPCI|nr:Putative Mitochondrion organization and biogenesis protein [Aspergillus calidoustus]
MTPICPGSARLTLPNVLRTLLNAPGAPQLRTPSVQFANPLSLPRHCVRSMITIGEIPITTPAPPQSPKPTEDESSAVVDTSGAPIKHSSKDALKTAKAAESHSSLRAKAKAVKVLERQKPNRKDQKRVTITTGLPSQKKKLEDWQIQKEALKKKFPTGWSPQKKLSPDAMEGIRHLHAMSPDKFTTAVLAEEFRVSPESIRRILKSKWRPSATEMEDRRKRWEKRHDRIWGHLSELGLRPQTEQTAHLSDTQKILYGNKKKP